MKLRRKYNKFLQPLMIPDSIWAYPFSNELPDFIPSLVQTPKTNLVTQLRELSISLNPREKECAWIAVALAHADLSDEELHELSDSLALSLNQQFILAVILGKLSHFESLITQHSNSALFQTIIERNKALAYRSATGNGNLPILKRLIQLTPIHMQDKIYHDAFHDAAIFGHLEVIEFLTAWAPHKLQEEIVQAGVGEKQSLFVRAAENGHVHILKHFMQLASDKGQAMIQANCELAFFQAVKNGHLEVVKLLIEWVPDIVSRTIKPCVYHGYEREVTDHELYRLAVESGNVAILQLLFQAVPDQVPTLLKTTHYYYWYSGIPLVTFSGSVPMLEHLTELAPDVSIDTLWPLFEKAIEKDDPDLLAYAISLAPDRHNLWHKLGDIIAIGSLPMLELLIDMASTTTLVLGLEIACKYGHRHIINRLLSIPIVFAVAEYHDHEFGKQAVYPFITSKLDALRSQKSSMLEITPNAVFDIDIENTGEIMLCYYFIRNMISRNSPELLDSIRFLLEIPAVKNMAEGVDGDNELLRLALSLNPPNQMASELLLTLPEVRQLAEHNNFYPNEIQADIDLHALAQNHESSLRRLTTTEETRLELALKRYGPKIEAIGAPVVVEQLKATLSARYGKNPATIKRHGKDYSLPLGWAAFVALRLTGREKEQALQAYYQHKDHTALRYLSKPNRWMHEHAGYVNRNSAGEKWSTFDEYLSFISLLYLAATDPDAEMAPCDGYTLDTRFERFIDELAHINRAHNWDGSREKRDRAGNSILNGEGHPIMEEYDDLEGDRPSCFSGVNRRLFQSILGHPLFKNTLTKEKVAAEFREFVRDYWKKYITERNRTPIKQAWDNVINGVNTDDDLKVLKRLDIPLIQQKAFKTHLTTRYGKQYTESSDLIKQVDEWFLLKDEKDAHAVTLGYTNWHQFLEAAQSPPVHIRPSAVENQFQELLNTLKIQLAQRLKEYPDAYQEAEQIIEALTEAADIFFAKAPSKQSFDVFQDSYRVVLHLPEDSALKQHRSILGSFFAAIHHFFVVLEDAVFGEYTARIRFFDSRTKSAKAVAHLEYDIDELISNNYAFEFFSTNLLR